MYIVLFSPGRKANSTEFMRIFRKRSAAERYVEGALRYLRKEYPATDWKKTDYTIAKELKCT